MHRGGRLGLQQVCFCYTYSSNWSTGHYASGWPSWPPASVLLLYILFKLEHWTLCIGVAVMASSKCASAIHTLQIGALVIMHRGGRHGLQQVCFCYTYSSNWSTGHYASGWP